MYLSCSCSAWKTSLRETLSSVRQLGFQETDLIAIPGWNQISPVDLANDFDRQAHEILSAVKESGLSLSGMNCAFPAPAQRDTATCQERMRQVRAMVRLLGLLRLKKASFYPGYMPPGSDWDAFFMSSLDTFREIVAEGRAAGIEFLPEPHAGTPFVEPGQLRRLLEELPDLQVAFDPSHFAAQGLTLEAYDFLLPHTAHVHVRDAGPGKIHLPCGTGIVRMEEMVEKLYFTGYNGPIVLEVLPGEGRAAEEDLLRLRARLVPLLEKLAGRAGGGQR